MGGIKIPFENGAVPDTSKKEDESSPFNKNKQKSKSSTQSGKDGSSSNFFLSGNNGGNNQISTTVNRNQNIEKMSLKELESVFERPIDVVDRVNIYRILVYGNTGVGKTHFALTMPEPVVVLDTEDRAKLILTKFSNEDGYQKHILLRQVRTMDGVDKMTDFAIAYLQRYYEEYGKIGTIVSDTVSNVWSYSHQKYIKENFGEDVEYKDIHLDPMTDYKHINSIHDKWRDKILDSGFHCCFIARQTQEFEDRFNPVGLKPEGKKDNKHAVDYYIFNYIEEGVLKSYIMKSSLELNYIDTVKNMDFNKFDNVVQKIKKKSGIRSKEDILKEMEELKQKKV